jgi:branched-chain amino acid aminotransferase
MSAKVKDQGAVGVPLIEMRPAPSPPVWKTPIEEIEFGTLFTPNFCLARFAEGRWLEAAVQPVTELRLHPGATVFHYAQTIFEGLKAFRQADGGIVLFRPEMNARRMAASCERLAMPRLPEELFMEACRRMVEVEHAQVPPQPGALYLRPTMFGVTPYVKVSPSTEYLFYVLTAVVGPYFKGTTGRDPGSVKVLVARSVTRASKGGMGHVKAGANYAGTLEITMRAREFGCGQVLFLDAKHDSRIEEMGGMNVMFVDGGALVTPPLGGSILPGVTRDSLLVLAREMGIPVREEAPEIDSIIAGIESGRVSEAMACGTAAVVTGIGQFVFEDGRTVALKHATPGPITLELFKRLRAIQYGEVPDTHGWITHVTGAKA